MTTTSELEEQIKLDLTKHEGCVFEVYLCSEGHKTAGIGHLLEDPDNWEIGDEVSSGQVLNWFQQDYKEAATDCCALFLNFASQPEHVQRVLINMAFNLGRSRLGKFKNMVVSQSRSSSTNSLLRLPTCLYHRESIISSAAF